MTVTVAVFVILSSIVSSIISATFSMGGASVLLGLLFLVVPDTHVAMVFHGILCICSNSFRSVAFFSSVNWRLVATIALGSLFAFGLLTLASIKLPKLAIFLMMGMLPYVNLFIPESKHFNMNKLKPSITVGFFTGLSHLLCGVSATFMHIFFKRHELSKESMVGTVAVLQVYLNVLKVIYFGNFLVFHGVETFGVVTTYALIVSVIGSYMGTNLGKSILSKMSQSVFNVMSQNVQVIIGLSFFSKAIFLASTQIEWILFFIFTSALFLALTINVFFAYKKHAGQVLMKDRF